MGLCVILAYRLGRLGCLSCLLGLEILEAAEVLSFLFRLSSDVSKLGKPLARSTCSGLHGSEHSIVTHPSKKVPSVDICSSCPPRACITRRFFCGEPLCAPSTLQAQSKPCGMMPRLKRPAGHRITKMQSKVR